RPVPRCLPIADPALVGVAPMSRAPTPCASSSPIRSPVPGRFPSITNLGIVRSLHTASTPGGILLVCISPYSEYPCQEAPAPPESPRLGGGEGPDAGQPVLSIN